MRPTTAARLARAAGAGHGWAWRRLDRSGGRGDLVAVDVVWAAWLDGAAGPLWELLAGWRRPAVGPHRGASLVALDEGGGAEPAVRAATVAAVTRTDHPIGDTARRRVLAGVDRRLVDAVCAAAAAEPAGPVAAFCREHHLAPADPAARAVFFLLTGQHEQRRAADPDGHLLATAYAAADADTRQRLRAALVHAADLDLIRIVAGGHRGRIGQAAPPEVEYLADQLATRQAWADLWQLTTVVSPAQAVALARRLPLDWVAPDDRAGRLRRTLIDTPPDALNTAPASAVRVGQFWVAGTAREVAFAADGSQLAVVHHAGLRMSEFYPGTDAWVSAYDLPAARRRWRRALTGPYPGLTSVLPLGDLVLATGGGSGRDGRLDRLWADRRVTVRDGLDVVSAPLPTPTGFAVATTAGMLLGSATAAIGREVRWEDIGLPRADLLPWAFATEPGSGLLAVGGDRLTVLDPDAAVLASVPTPGDRPGTGKNIEWVAFDGPDRLLSYGQRSGTVTAWRFDGRTLCRTGELPVRLRPSIAVFPAYRLLVLADHGWHATDTLAEVAALPGLDLVAGDRLVASPAGDWAAAVGGKSITLYRFEPARWMAEIAHQPVPAARPGDLDRVITAQRGAVRPEARQLLALLRACLEYRFGAEVQLGAAAGPSTSEHDIALSAPADGPD